MVILVGVVVGFYIRFASGSEGAFAFSEHTFFLYVLPPIIFEAGYVQCNNRVFMDNIGTILVNAIIGTAFNTFTVGYAVYFVANAIGIDMSPLEGLVGARGRFGERGHGGSAFRLAFYVLPATMGKWGLYFVRRAPLDYRAGQHHF